MTNRSVASVDRPPLAVAYCVAYPVVYVLYAPSLLRPAQSVDPHSKDLSSFQSPSLLSSCQFCCLSCSLCTIRAGLSRLASELFILKSDGFQHRMQRLLLHRRQLNSDAVSSRSVASVERPPLAVAYSLAYPVVYVLYASVSRGWRQSCSFYHHTVFTIEYSAYSCIK